ncbi:DUF5956 family protein [Arthrobacter sp. H35-D1]|uniref:DUF5956 family protein n=1 Tax=Arthrobacter sp. H35-D1 TaxID=3046202 RepID=UPI0024B966C0|nr:DUF5956 family protein [Arthrobacter sp. H35-D1]MDJ0311962.1 DUF5956 family protein [Arthrobacter sp. H35-D1]
MWDDVKPTNSEQGWEPLPENGWFALMAWVAGPANVGRAAQSDEGRAVRVVHVHDGVEPRTVEPFAEGDRRSVDESVNEFLLEAGVPARPAGFDWFMRIPEGWPAGLSVADELSSQITRSWENDTHPEALLPLFERAVQAFYADAPA